MRAEQPVALRALVLHASNGDRVGAGLISTTAAADLAGSTPAMPSLTPTSVPTSSDTFLVEVTLGLSASDDRDLTADVIFPSVAASVADVEESDLINFRVVSTSGFTRRRRKLLGTAIVAFDVQASLSSTSAASPEAYTTTLTNEFSTAVSDGSLSTSMASNTNYGTASATSSALTTVVRTPSPYPQPTPMPVAPTTPTNPPTPTPDTPTVTPKKGGGDDDDGVNSASTSIILISIFGALGGLLLVGAGVFAFMKYRNAQFSSTLANDYKNQAAGGGGGFEDELHVPMEEGAFMSNPVSQDKLRAASIKQPSLGTNI
jgi:hypothetical protein